MTEEELRRLARIKGNLERRSFIYQAIRRFFCEQGFLEIETPVRMPAIAPEQFIVPIESEGWFLSTSPELHMKRLMAAGYRQLFQISRCFRKGERGRWHNPEFTMLEWYRTDADYLQMIQDTEMLVSAIARQFGQQAVVSYGNRKIDLTPPWPRLTVQQAFLNTAKWDPVTEPDSYRFDLDLVEKVIPSFTRDRPTVLLDYPATMASLALLKRSDPAVAERAEVFIGGLEIANAYSELVDADEQKRRFHEEAEIIMQEQGRKAPLPERFLEVLPYLPECGGIALGVDRLMMLFCDALSIDEVMGFTVDNI
ncbi:EF-P lysine aminoacylase EpmA [Chloroflexota bacterium]